MRRKTKNIAISLENYDKSLKIASKSETWDDTISCTSTHNMKVEMREKWGQENDK